MQRHLAGLRCARCRTDRPHTVTYLGNVFASATCTICEETFRPRADVLIADYVRDFEHRIARKPGRMLNHARRHPFFFVFHYLPRGLVSKPREVLQEWEVLARTNQAGSKQADPKQVGPKQVGPKQVGPKQVGPKQVDRGAVGAGPST